MKFNLNMAQTPTRAVPEIGNTNAGFDFPPLFLNGARCVIWKHVEHGTASLAAGLPETAGKNQNLNCEGGDTIHRTLLVELGEPRASSVGLQQTENIFAVVVFRFSRAFGTTLFFWCWFPMLKSQMDRPGTGCRQLEVSLQPAEQGPACFSP